MPAFANFAARLPWQMNTMTCRSGSFYRAERLRAGCLTNGPRIMWEAIDVATHLEPLYGYTSPYNWLSKCDVDKACETGKAQTHTD